MDQIFGPRRGTGNVRRPLNPNATVVIAVQNHGSLGRHFDGRSWEYHRMQLRWALRNDYRQRYRLTPGSSDHGAASSLGQGGGR